MRKIILIWLFLFLGLSYQSFAKAGMASDEKELVLILVGLLLLVEAIFEGTDYLKKNGKTLLLRIRTFLRTKILTLRNSH